MAEMLTKIFSKTKNHLNFRGGARAHGVKQTGVRGHILAFLSS